MIKLHTLSTRGLRESGWAVLPEWLSHCRRGSPSLNHYHLGFPSKLSLAVGGIVEDLGLDKADWEQL